MQWKKSDFQVRVGLGDVVRAWGKSFLLNALWLSAIVATFVFVHDLRFGFPVAMLFFLMMGQYASLSSIAWPVPLAVALRRAVGAGYVGKASGTFVGACVVEVQPEGIVLWRRDGRMGRMAMGRDLQLEVARDIRRFFFWNVVRSVIRSEEGWRVELLDDGAVAEVLVGRDGVLWMAEDKLRPETPVGVRE